MLRTFDEQVLGLLRLPRLHQPVRLQDETLRGEADLCALASITTIGLVLHCSTRLVLETGIQRAHARLMTPLTFERL